MTNRKPLSRRAMTGIKAKTHSFAQVAHWKKLSELLDATANHNICFPEAKIDQIFLCGSLEEMTREWCEEPLSKDWSFALPFVFKHRAPVYRYNGLDVEIAVKLVSHRESWFPDCEDVRVAIPAWRALEEEWKTETDIPLLSTPSKTGQALLWENLPKEQSFPALPDDVETIIRANSTQHRIEWLRIFPEHEHDQQTVLDRCYQYDGRWMYAALCSLDRLPIGGPRRTGAAVPYEPSWHHVAIKIPDDWKHIGLIPRLSENGWEWPNTPGMIFETWVSEPELTLALNRDPSKGPAPCWEIVDHFDGYAWDKGRPLEAWAKKLIRMRHFLQLKESDYISKSGGEHYGFASAACRQILNHTIGSFHARGFEREEFVLDDNFRLWRRDNAHLLESRNVYRVEGGYMVPTWVADNSPLSINMPHWSAAIWALERARVAQWALRCDPSTIVKINGDAIYLTAPAPWEGEDNGNLGQLRRKV